MQRTFALKQSLGIIGGKPNHALYFIGVVGEAWLLLSVKDIVFLVKPLKG